MSLTLTRRHNVDRFGYLIPTKYGNLPMVGAVATYRPGEGRFGGAVAVEEGTTNLHSESMWSYFQGLSYFSVSDIEIDGFTWAKRFERLEERNAYFQVDIPCNPNTTYTLSFYIRGVKISPDSYVSIYLEDDDGVSSGNLRCNLTNQFQRFTRTITTSSNATKIVRASIHFGSNSIKTGEIIEVADWQLEAKPFATSFVDGTRPDGILAYPVALPDDYTIACYRKSHTDEDYKHVVKRSDGKVFVDGVEDSEYDVGWLGCDGDTLMLSNQTGLVDELLILPYAASEEEIVSWYEAQGPLPPHPQALLQWDRQTVRPAQMVKL